MRYSILHLSDLHRDLSEEAGNPALIDSLVRDFDQFARQDTPILKPTICIVSGDLVYGAPPLISDGFTELSRQCDQAVELLVAVADRLFGGDREKVAILPGNHDVSYADVLASGVAVPIPSEVRVKAALVAELFRPNSMLRWSWNDLGFFRITDVDRYRERMRHFVGLYESFYENRRKYSLDPESQFDVFDYPEIEFSIVTLNSCYNNDPLHRAGAFEATSVVQACRALSDPKRVGWLTAAAWHHSLFGGPEENDYLDAEVLQSLIDAGASLGFHGHQHRTDCVDQRYRVGPSERKMTIVSAGTLCAGRRALPVGETRSYNIVEIDTTAWTGRVHQRSMVNRTYNLPIWGPGHFVSTNTSYLDFSISPPVSERPVGFDERTTIEHADGLLARRRFTEALELLRGLAHVPLARPLLTYALDEVGDQRGLITLLWPPHTIQEAITIGAAIMEVGTRDEAHKFAQLPLVSTSSDTSVREVLRRLNDRNLR